MKTFLRLSLIEKLQSKPFYLSFCFLCLVAALLIAVYVTRSGTWVSWDSATYINTAENLYHGRGFVSAGDEPYKLWPPLYPMMITGLMYFGISADQAARILPILTYALTIFPLFLLCKATTRSLFAGYVVCLAYLAFTPMFWLGTAALTDMICIFFTVTTVLFLVLFVQSQHRAMMLLGLAGLFTALASLTRFMGAIVLLVGLVAILEVNTKIAVWSQQSSARAIVIKLRGTVNQSLLYLSIGLLPLLAWQLYRPRGSSPGGASLVTNVYRVLHTIFVDFLSPLPRGVAYTLVAAVTVSLILLIVRGKLIGYLKRNLLLISYIVVYLFLLAIIESVESTEPISTRYVAPIYPFILLVAVPLALYIYTSR
jgi:4-amino-4-deoxy-L-arabinose transferase-like glycosyltransferase